MAVGSSPLLTLPHPGQTALFLYVVGVGWVHLSTLPFLAVKAASPSFVDSFCLRYLPGAKKHGSWWKARVPWREDKNPSLGVHVSGQWKDFSRGDRGDITDLFARIEGCSNAEAVQRLAAMMGVRA